MGVRFIKMVVVSCVKCRRPQFVVIVDGRSKLLSSAKLLAAKPTNEHTLGVCIRVEFAPLYRTLSLVTFCLASFHLSTCHFHSHQQQLAAPTKSVIGCRLTHIFPIIAHFYASKYRHVMFMILPSDFYDI